MNKLLSFFILVAVCAAHSVAAQRLSNNDKPLKSNTAHKTESSTETEDVKDYKSFQAYVAKEESKLAKPRMTNETGAVRRILKEKGFEISSSTVWAPNSDRGKLAYLSLNNIGVAVFDSKSHHIEIYSVNGEKLREIPLSKSSISRVAFSDSRLMILRSGSGWEFGFDIYDNSGKLLKQSDAEAIDGYVISNAQKYFAVTAGHPKTGDYFVLYDMDGNELWRYKTVAGDPRARIVFSLDDKFVLVKMPIYWEKDAVTGRSTGKAKSNKFYLFDIANKKFIADGNYEQ